MVVAVDERSVVGLDEVLLVQGIVDELFNFLVDIFRIVVDAIVRGEAHGVVVGRGDGNGADGCFCVLSLYLCGHGFTHLLGRYAFLLELNHVVAAAREVDTLRKSANAEEGNANGCSHEEDGDRAFCLFHEAHAGVLHEVAAEGGGESKAEPLVAVVEVFVNHTRHPNCGEERGADTDAEREGEASDGASAEVIEDDGGDD